MDDLRERFLRNVRFASGGMGHPQEVEAPLPEYFSERGRAGDNRGLMELASSLGLGALAIPAPEAAPVLLPAAGLGAMGAFSRLNEAGKMHDAADMWSDTGLPQRPDPNEAIRNALMGRRR
jgi:hypothetical protein